MKRYVFLLLVLLAGKFSGFASHIVGGEFELLHVQDFRYRLNMILYFDELNGEPGAKDARVTVYIYRKSDNVQMRTLTLSQAEDELVPYSNVACTDDDELLTSRIVYTALITLPASEFSDPEGYYVSWERCCRNYSITNIFSDDPADLSGISAGQTFYLEFPPVTINGEPFVNSTPRLFPPLRDFGCSRQFYYADFGGVDDDGDSLVYTMVTPFSTVDTRQAFPSFPSPGPYPEVIWKDSLGYGVDNIMEGNPDLAISRDGLLTVTPGEVGLFVFAVKCEEFRDGEKIGEMRRDFQIKVIDCPGNDPPEVVARESNSTIFYQQGDIINFQVADTTKCIDVLVTDVPVNPPDSVESVTVRLIPINFDADLDGLEDFPDIILEDAQDTARFEVCFPDCPYVRNRPYQIGIIAFDDACPQPALDTVIVTLNVEPPTNSRAYFADTKFGPTRDTVFAEVTDSADRTITIDINAFDNDNDQLELEFIPLGFDMDRVGMSFSTPIYTAGQAQTTFNWDFDCLEDDISFDRGREVNINGNLGREYQIQVIADDMDQCLFEDPEILTMTLRIEFPGQTKPNVFEANNPSSDYLRFDYELNETILHLVRAADQDQDEIILGASGVNFDFEEYGVVFPSAQGRGILSQEFLWQLACSIDLGGQDTFRVEFFTEDIDACKLTNSDTLTVDFVLSPPPSTRPEIDVSSLNNLRLTDEDSIRLIIGDELRLIVEGQEFDGDSLELFLLENEDLPGLEFEPVTGIRRVSSVLSWTPGCSVFTSNRYSETIDLTFVLWDKNCYLPQYDTATVTVHVEDVPQRKEFAITNIITPKSSPDLNDYFGYYTISNPTEEDRLIYLPIDNCAGQFEEVIIHNRWGRTVFSSRDRDFRWYGENVVAGVYFYTIFYSNTKFQGSLTVMY